MNLDKEEWKQEATQLMDRYKRISPMFFAHSLLFFFYTIWEVHNQNVITVTLWFIMCFLGMLFVGFHFRFASKRRQLLKEYDVIKDIEKPTGKWG